MTTDQSSSSSVWPALFLSWTLGWGSGALRALVAMKGWEWFVADTFGIQTLSFIQTFGITLLITFATINIDTSQETTKKNLVYVAILDRVTSVIMSGIYFLSLWILSGWL